VLSRLATLAAGRPRTVVAVAVALALVAATLGGNVASRLAPYGAKDPASESARADAALHRVGVNADVDALALVRPGAPVRSARGRARVERVAALLRADPDVARVVTFARGGPALVSADGRATYVAASFRPGVDGSDAADRLATRLDRVPGVTLGGGTVAEREVNEQVSKDLARAEMLAFPLLFLLSFLFFRSLVAALLPLLVGGLAIVYTFLGLRIASELGSVSVFALNLVTGLGLGLAIDYSLFLVSRYREEIAKDGAGPAALRRTLATAGRTVLFSSLTVTAALASMLVFPQRFLYSMGLGGMMISLIAASVALVVLPAVLFLLGPRVNALAPRRLQRAADRDARAVREGAWYRLSRVVMRRPWPIAIASGATLVALGLPFTGIRFTSVDASVLPPSASARQVHEALRSEFPRGQTDPIYAVVRAPGPAAARAYARRAAAVPDVASVRPPRRVARGLWVVDAYSRTDPLSERSQRLAHALRRIEPGAPVLVAGFTAAFVDLKASLVEHLPAALAIVVGATLVVLFLMTGSVVLPLKALVMNVLTLSAAFGILVLVFQDGRLEGLLDYRGQGALESTQPIVLFAVAFGLSTDYGVFLLSRIKEARDSGLPDSEAVAVGLERTGRIVTAAAVLFCVAIGAFSTSQIIFIKELGLGTALAVLIDATLVRALLVPSLMELLGRRNWWSPRPLRRLWARVHVDEGGARPAGVG
jgi:RND superfamily putative drug exporter